LRPSRIRDKKMAEYKKNSLEELLELTHDREAWYWLGMAYWERHDYGNAAVWLEKTMNDTGNEWAGKARFNLALLHKCGLHPNASKDEALRLFEINLSGSMSNLYAGFLYFEGTETMQNIAKGKEMVEKAIALLIKEDGNDNYLSQSECYDIGWIYYKENNGEAYQWFKKCIARCNDNYASDRRLKDLANRNMDVLRRDHVKEV